MRPMIVVGLKLAHLRCPAMTVLLGCYGAGLLQYLIYMGFETAALTVSSCGDITETLWDFMDHG